MRNLHGCGYFHNPLVGVHNDLNEDGEEILVSHGDALHRGLHHQRGLFSDLAANEDVDTRDGLQDTLLVRFPRWSAHEPYVGHLHLTATVRSR